VRAVFIKTVLFRPHLPINTPGMALLVLVMTTIAFPIQTPLMEPDQATMIYHIIIPPQGLVTTMFFTKTLLGEKDLAIQPFITPIPIQEILPKPHYIMISPTHIHLILIFVTIQMFRNAKQ
jgi:hypothetical protein